MARLTEDNLRKYVSQRCINALEKGKLIKEAAVAKRLISTLDGYEDLQNFGDLRQIDQASAVVIDVRDSSVRAATLGPYRTYITIECFLPVMAKLVAFFGGTVVQFTGDGLFALFYRTDIQTYTRACYCAAYMMLTIHEIINPILSAAGIPSVGELPPLECGAGLDIGSCFAVKTGSEAFATITPYGECINNASHLSSGVNRVKLTDRFYKFVKNMHDANFGKIDDVNWHLNWAIFKFPTLDF